MKDDRLLERFVGEFTIIGKEITIKKETQSIKKTRVEEKK